MSIPARGAKPTRDELRLTKPEGDWEQKKSFLIPVLMSFCMLQLLFLGNMSLLYGAVYGNGAKVHALKVVMVDYDGGIIGESLARAYTLLKGDTFPTLEAHSVSEYPDVDALESVICKGDFWAAVYALPAASARLSAALSGGEAAGGYNSSDAIQYIYNEARYPTWTEGFVTSKMETLISTSRSTYTQINGSRALTTVNASDPAAANAFLNPISPAAINLKATGQGSRVLYNTASVALSIVQQFFFILAINGVSQSLRLFSILTPAHNVAMRLVLAAAYTLIGSLCWVGYVWAFKENWKLNGGQFMLIWMNDWLFMAVNFLFLNAAASYIPMQFLPYLVLTWVMLNITSALVAFPLAAGFFRFGYALPGHNWYEIFIHIASGGCYNRLYRNLPIMFAWLVVGLAVAVPASVHRSREARRAEAEERELDSRSDSATTAEDGGPGRLNGTDRDTDGGMDGTPEDDFRHTEGIHRRSSSASLAAAEMGRVYSPSMPVAFEGIRRISTRRR